VLDVRRCEEWVFQSTQCIYWGLKHVLPLMQIKFEHITTCLNRPARSSSKFRFSAIMSLGIYNNPILPGKRFLLSFRSRYNIRSDKNLPRFQSGSFNHKEW